jgi:hypothetical protein
MSSFSFACGNACVKSIFFPFRLCIAVSVFTFIVVLHCTTGAKYSVQSMPWICILMLMQRRTFYLFKDLAGSFLHRYVYMLSRYLVLGGKFFFVLIRRFLFPRVLQFMVFVLQLICLRRPIFSFVHV